MSDIRVRIAPSPTGKLHIGNARSALFNELFARQNGGVMVVRVEDTDQVRSKVEYEKEILEGLEWLGLEWQEGPDKGGDFGPYRQSERRDMHKLALEELLESEAAYQEEGSEAIKLKVDNSVVTFNDEVRGSVSISPDTWGGDFIIARSISDPVFHLAVVVDDEAMKISHVIRGEDHLTNTARHILIQKALGYKTPIYAHLPLLLDEKKRKLSKRTDDVSLLSYRDQGFLPEAVFNYLALLGWHPKTDQEFFSHESLIKEWKLNEVQKGGAIFSLEKLQAHNKYYLRQLSKQELWEKAKPFFEQQKIEYKSDDFMADALALEQERVTTLAELPTAISFALSPVSRQLNTEILIWKKSNDISTKKYLESLIDHLATISDSDFNDDDLTKNLLGWIDDNSLGRGEVLWPMRVALTGREHSPGPFEVAGLLGKEKTLSRLHFALSLFN